MQSQLTSFMGAFCCQPKDTRVSHQVKAETQRWLGDTQRWTTLLCGRHPAGSIEAGPLWHASFPATQDRAGTSPPLPWQSSPAGTGTPTFPSATIMQVLIEFGVSVPLTTDVALSSLSSEKTGNHERLDKSAISGSCGAP